MRRRRWAQYELDARELRRITGMAADPGMATNWTLYRANRLTPLNRILPLTLAALGPGLREVLDHFWRSCPASLQSAGEAAAFVAFLRRQLAEGAILDALLAEVLEFEMAVSELRFLSRRAALAEKLGEGLVRHPLIRVLRFRHEPSLVLGRLAEGHPPGRLPEGEHYLLLDWRMATLRLGALAPTLGRALLGLGRPAQREVAALREAGYLVPGDVRAVTAAQVAAVG